MLIHKKRRSNFLSQNLFSYEFFNNMQEGKRKKENIKYKPYNHIKNFL